MWTLVNTLHLDNIQEDISGSRLRDRETYRVNQLPATVGAGNMFRTGGDPESGSGTKSGGPDYDVPFHSGPPHLNPIDTALSSKGVRIFMQTKVLALQKTCLTSRCAS